MIPSEEQGKLQVLIDELAGLGSSDDIVWVDGVETTPAELPEIDEYTSLRKHITFVTLKDGKAVKGTLKQMIVDRGGTGSGIAPVPEPDAPADFCPTCGRAY